MFAQLVRLMKGMFAATVTITGGMMIILCAMAHADPQDIPLRVLGGMFAVASFLAIPGSVLIARRERPNWKWSNYAMFSLFGTGGLTFLAGDSYAVLAHEHSLSFGFAVVLASLICGFYSGIAYRAVAGKLKPAEAQ
jgi:hypothetical protein